MHEDCRLGKRLEDPLWPSHTALDVQRAYVLPVLLQKGDKEVDPEVDIGNQVI